MAKTKVKAIYYPKKDKDILSYYKKLVKALAGFTAKYGISVATMTLLQTHSTNLAATHEQALADADKAHQSFGIKNTEFADAKLDLLRVLNQIQNASNFLESDAEALGFRIITAPVDLKTVKPRITGITTDEVQVIIDWVRGSMQGIIIYGSYDTKNFTEIGRDTRSPYEDARKNQTNQPEERYYRMKYMKNDKPVGLFSSIEKVIADVY